MVFVSLRWMNWMLSLDLYLDHQMVKWNIDIANILICGQRIIVMLYKNVNSEFFAKLQAMVLTKQYDLLEMQVWADSPEN